MLPRTVTPARSLGLGDRWCCCRSSRRGRSGSPWGSCAERSTPARARSRFRYNFKSLATAAPTRRAVHGTRQKLRTARHRGEVVSVLGIQRPLQGHDAAGRRAVLHPAAAAERDRHAAHGPRVPAHADGPHDPLPPDARRQHAVAGGHRSRGHRHADRRRAAVEGAKASRATTRARRVHRARVGVEGGVGLGDHAADAAPGRLRRLDARALHDGRRPVRRGARDVRAPVRGRPHLSRQAARQLGPEARHRGVGPRSRQRGRAGQAVGDPLSAGGRLGFDRGRDHAAGDDAGRRGRRGESGRRALPRVRRQERHAAADRPHDSGRRRRLRRPRVRHRRGQDHAGARLQRLADRAAARARAAHDLQSRRDGERQRAGEVPRPRSLRRAQGGARRSRRRRTAGVGEGAQDGGAALRAHRRGGRADADRPVVHGADQAGAGHASVLSAARRSSSSASRRWTRASCRRTAARPRRCASCRASGCPPTITGSTTSRTGASRGSCGGATRSPRGTTRPATCTSRAPKPRRARRRRRSSAARRRRSRATRTCSTRGSRPRSGATPRSAGRERRVELQDVPAVVDAGHRLRHHLLLGRADDHDDDLLHRPRAVPRRLHQRDRPRRGRPEDVEVEGQRARPARPHRRRRRRDAGGEEHRQHDGPAAGGEGRAAHAQGVSGGHPGVRRRRGALHVRVARHVQPHAQLRPEALRGLPQLLQQAVERDALRADERRGQGLRPRRGRAADADVRRPLAARPPAAGEARHRVQHRAVPLRPRRQGAVRVRVGRVLRLVRRARQGAARAGRRARRRGRRARHAQRAGARARGDAAARASVRAVHHRGAVADGGAARRQVRRVDLHAAVPEGQLRARRRMRRTRAWRR